MAFNNTHTDILIAGALAAFSIDLLVYPIDTIKTRIQSPDYTKIYKNANGTLNRALFRGLYQGVGSVILATVPSAGAFFTTYEAAKASLVRLNRYFPQSQQLPRPIINSLASSTGELVSCLILTPAEVLKQNAQVINRSSTSSPGNQLLGNSSTRAALQPFLNRPTLLFRGYAALVARNLPFTALHFPLYEHLKAGIHANRKAKGIAKGTMLEKALVTAVSAGSAGSIAAVVTTPIDVVKTRIMLAAGKEDQSRGGQSTSGQPSNASSSNANWPPPAERTAIDVTSRSKTASGRVSGWRVGREVWRSDGVRGLFRGAALRGGWTAFGSGLYLGIYESGRTWLERRRVGEE